MFESKPTYCPLPCVFLTDCAQMTACEIRKLPDFSYDIKYLNYKKKNIYIFLFEDNIFTLLIDSKL